MHRCNQGQSLKGGGGRYNRDAAASTAFSQFQRRQVRALTVTRLYPTPFRSFNGAKCALALEFDKVTDWGEVKEVRHKGVFHNNHGYDHNNRVSSQFNILQ